MTNQILQVCGTEDRLSLLLRGGDVLRYHTEGKQIQPQTNAEHTWRVLVILLHLWPNASRELILAALYHDVSEGYTGDIHHILKNLDLGLRACINALEAEFHKVVHVPGYADLSDVDMARLKCVDILEVFLYMNTQMSPGGGAIFNRASKVLRAYVEELPEEDRVRVFKVVGWVL